jgi:tetratricopeptide (TPR) repeat protein
MSTAARIDELRSKFEDSPRRYFAPLANELRKAGDLSGAIALCREFLPKQPEHMSGYIVFGQALYEAGEVAEARTVFEQALALDPENLKALSCLGDIAKWEGDTAAARRWYERVLESDPRNDDIAAQLATLGTQSFANPLVAPPDRPARPTADALPMSAVPVADIEQVDPEASLDDPFGFADATTEPEPFEEGLLAPEWPDTSELEARISAPRAEAPRFAPLLSPDAAAAFGLESSDLVITPPPAQSSAIVDEPIAATVVPPVMNPVPDATMARVDVPVMEAIGEPVSALAAEPAAEPASEPVFDSVVEPTLALPVGSDAKPDVDGAHVELEWIVPLEPASAPTLADDLPWLPPAPERDGGSEGDALGVVDGVDGLFQEVVTINPPEREAPLEEASFADVMPDESAPAFVTETMGELLLAQGFTAQAVSVYEELVRRRPYDPMLSTRLAEVREALAAETAGSSPARLVELTADPVVPRYTARERFAQLAARRVSRRTPPQPSVVIEAPAESLGALFGRDVPVHEDLEGRAFANAFAPMNHRLSSDAEVPFDVAMFAGASAAESRPETPKATPAIVPAAAGPFSFDRFFPDPSTSTAPSPPAPSPHRVPDLTATTEGESSTVSDDLAQFSAWLKGLGTT